MSAWPDTMKVGPIRGWPGTLTPDSRRKPSPFDASLTSTMKTLDREIYNLVDTAQQQRSAELLLAIDPSQFRLDGRPYASAKSAHPGIVFSIDSRHGHLSYPCDTFMTWEANLRAIALALEALRKVDRYGVTKRGEQYRGFLAIEGATAMPFGFATADLAADYLVSVLEGHGIAVLDDMPPRQLVRNALRLTHPDQGGDAAAFQRVTLAEATLREAGLL